MSAPPFEEFQKMAENGQLGILPSPAKLLCRQSRKLQLKKQELLGRPGVYLPDPLQQRPGDVLFRPGTPLEESVGVDPVQMILDRLERAQCLPEFRG
jgi:hypothetical protein